MYELVIVWDTGEKEVFTYNTEEEAEKAGEGYKTAFGQQIWYCVRDKIN